MIDLSNNQTKIQFSYFLKEMAYKKGITRERLAIRSDKSIKTVTRYLSGDLSQLPKTRIKYHTFKRLLGAIDCNENEFSRFAEKYTAQPIAGEIRKENRTSSPTDSYNCRGFKQRLNFTKASTEKSINLSTDDLKSLISQLISTRYSVIAIVAPPGNGKTLLLHKLHQFGKSSLNWHTLSLNLRQDWDKDIHDLYPRLNGATCVFLDNYEKNKNYKKYAALKLIKKLTHYCHVIFTCLPEDTADIKSELTIDTLNLETLDKKEIGDFIKEQELALGDKALSKDVTTLTIQSNLMLDLLSIPFFIKTICHLLRSRRISSTYSPLNVKWLMDQLHSHLLNHKNHKSRKDHEKSQLLTFFRNLPLTNMIQYANIFYKNVTHYGLLQTLRDKSSHEFLGTLLLLDIKNNKNEIFDIVETTLKNSQHDTTLISIIAKSITFTHQVDLILQRLTTDIREILWQNYLSQNEGYDKNIEILYHLDNDFLRKREITIRKNLKNFNRWRNDELLKLTHKLTNKNDRASDNTKEKYWNKPSIIDTKEQISKFISGRLIPPGSNIDTNQLEVIMSESCHRFNSKLVKTINITLNSFPNHELCLYITRAFKRKLTQLAYDEHPVIYSEILKCKTLLLVNPALKAIYFRLIANKSAKIKHRNIAAETVCSRQLENKDLLFMSNLLIENLKSDCENKLKIKLHSTIFEKLINQNKNYANSTLKILKKSNSQFYFLLKKQYDRSIQSSIHNSPRQP